MHVYARDGLFLRQTVLLYSCDRDVCVCGNDSDDVDEHVLRLLYSLRFLGSDAHQVEIIDA